MNYEIEVTKGHKHIVRHFFKAHEIQVDSRWIGVCGHIVTVEGINSYGSESPWYEIVYSWEENGVKQTHDKDLFSFQCRYCLIVQD